MNGQTNGQMHDGHWAMTLARWPMASGDKNEDQRENNTKFL